MAEIRTVTTLTRKRDEIVSSIEAYERKLAQARADLAHITAAITIFQADGNPADMPRYVDVHRIFTRHEIPTLCRGAIAREGPLDTRELALRVMAAKGLDTGDAVLRQAIAHRIVQALMKAAHRGVVVCREKRRGVRVWELP